MIYPVSTIGIGSIIAIMIMFNSILSSSVDLIVALWIIHFVGLVAVSIICFFKAKSRQSISPQWYLYSAGVIGIGLNFSNIICFQNIGASLSLSLGILGQMTGSIIIDYFGLFGMKKHRFKVPKLIGVLVGYTGVFLMVESWQGDALFVMLGFLTGVTVILTMVINTRLSLHIGVYEGTRINFFTGLLGVTLIAIFAQVDVIRSIQLASQVHPLILLGGGLTGVIIVAGINTILPKIATIHSTLLLFTGQISTSILIDHYLYERFSQRIFLGSMIVMGGLMISFASRSKNYIKVRSSISNTLK